MSRKRNLDAVEQGEERLELAEIIAEKSRESGPTLPCTSLSLKFQK